MPEQCSARVARVQDGQTALMYAAARGAIDCVKLLLHAGASLNHVSHVRLVALSIYCTLFCGAVSE